MLGLFNSGINKKTICEGQFSQDASVHKNERPRKLNNSTDIARQETFDHMYGCEKASRSR